MLQLFIILTTSNLLQTTEFGTSYFKYSERLYLCLNNYHCNLNSKFNHLFHSLNVIECTLGCQYISVTTYLLQTYSSGKPLFKGQGPVNLTFKHHCFGRINCEVYMRRSKSLDYKQLNETGEKVKKEEVEGNQIEEVSNLFRTTSISKDLQSLNSRRQKYGQAESSCFSNRCRREARNS